MATNNNQQNTNLPARVPLNEQKSPAYDSVTEKSHRGSGDRVFGTVITNRQTQDPAPPKPKR